MATSGLVNASTCDKQDSNENDNRDKKFYFGVFFDGTNNNMVQKNAAKAYRKQSENEDEWELEVVQDNGTTFSNGANQIPQTKEGKPSEGYSNIAILHSFYQSMSQEQFDKCKANADVWVYNIYVEGAGTDYDQSWFSNMSGKATGKGNAGVSHLVCKAVAMVRERLKAVKAVDRPKTEVHFDVFGFSRGAACARLFSYLALRTSRKQRLNCEGEFENTLAKNYYKPKEIFLHFLDFLGGKDKLKQVTVDFLGLFDTVSSIGGLSTDSYANNVSDYGLNSPTLDKVLNTFHLCAMDEFREHFALTDIGNACHKGGNAEVFIPGCHTDVGGGYKTGKYSFTLISDNNRVFPKDRIEAPSLFLPVNEDTLKTLGWGNDKEIWTTYDPNTNISFVSVKRHIESGYSNIPLTMMKVRTEDKVHRKAFISFDGRYDIAGKFSTWKSQLLPLSYSSGRKWYYPNDSFSSESYQKLRAYLHFSSKESFVGTVIGNAPNYYNKIMCRPIYHGDGNFEKTYLQEAYSTNSERELRIAPPGNNKDGWNKELNGKLLPNTDYLVGDKLYKTDKVGRVVNVSGRLKRIKGSQQNRNEYQQGQSVILKDGTKGIDDGGHLIAAMFDGAGEQINYVPMLSSINRSAGLWYDMEQEWKNALAKDPPDDVVVDINILYDSNKRPKGFRVFYSINGNSHVKSFRN